MTNEQAETLAKAMLDDVLAAMGRVCSNAEMVAIAVEHVKRIGETK